MAERRMFSLKIIDTDLFLDMPSSTQLLYFHLSMRADDDGFISSPKKIMKIANCSDDDIKILIAKKFIIPFESGICVIKHWRIHNYIQKDRYNETFYKDDKCKLINENGAYEILDTECIQDVSRTDTQVRLGKERLDKDNIKDIRSNKSCNDPKPIKFNENSFEIQLVNYLIVEILKDLPNSKVPTTLETKQKWALEIDRMKRLDHRTEDEIRQAIKFAMEDSFWKSNIRSTGKFREKFETLFLQSQGKSKKKPKNNDDLLEQMKDW